jgi:hypothetical protein
MPLQQGATTRDGERVGYYRWGDEGKMYIYTPNNRQSRERAKALAKRQGRAIEAQSN